MTKRRGGVLCFLGGLLAGLGLPASPAAAQQPSPPPVSEAVQREVQAVEETLFRARTDFGGTQQSRSIVMFDDIISRLENLRRQGTLPVRARDMLVEAYEKRGRAYYNIGLQEKAADSFRSLIQVQPQYAMSPQDVSQKIVEYFNSVKRALVGYLAV